MLLAVLPQARTTGCFQLARRVSTMPPAASAILAMADSPVRSMPEPRTPLKRKRSSGAASPVVVTPGPTEAAVTLTSDMIETINPSAPFVTLGVSPQELRPSRTLTTGQCFHWTAVPSKNEHMASKTSATKSSAWGTHNATEWIGTIRSNNESVVLVIRETPNETLYRPLTSTTLDLPSLLNDYFQTEENLASLYQEWSSQCARVKTIAGCLQGVRIINQDPFECLISFICSSNNNIPRITKMLTAIRSEYGEPLLTIGDSVFYSFPSLETLQNHASEQRLRDLGLGYRAKYIIETIHILADLGGESYLHQLRTPRDPLLVQEKLIQFRGVGRKVADCVALFSLKQDSAIPVDVHVWNIARRDYDSERVLHNVKSITPAVYKTVGDLFRNRFPNKAGWAHSLLFVVSFNAFGRVWALDALTKVAIGWETGRTPQLPGGSTVRDDGRNGCRKLLHDCFVYFCFAWLSSPNSPDV